MEIRQGYLQANDLTFHYRAAGSPDAPLALLLHGYPDFSYGWRYQLPALAGRFHAVAPDQRGYALSSKPQGVENYRPKHLIEDVKAMAAHFQPGLPFTLIAHDWGGAIAWAFALKYPDLLERLIIVNAVHPGVFQREMAANPAQAEASQYILGLRAEGSEARLAADGYTAMFHSAAPIAGLLSPEDRAAYLAAWSEPGALTGMVNWYRAMKLSPPNAGGGTPMYKDEALIVRVPTLVVWGLKDEALLPSCLDGLDGFVPGVKIVTVPEGTHWVNQEYPEAVNQAILDFCDLP